MKMNSRVGSFLVIAVLAGTAAVAVTFRSAVLEKSLEFWLNQTQAEFFGGTLDFEGVKIDRQFRMSIEKLRGEWQMQEGVFPFEVTAICLEDPVYRFLMGRSVKITFERFRPQNSQHPGIAGEAILINDAAGTMELNARFLGLDLVELTALNPENLNGSSGMLTGEFRLTARASGEQDFKVDLKVIPPGGRLQSRFFDLLLPYLPETDQKALAMIAGAKTVLYKEADIHAGLESAGTVKVLFHILVPEYNLNLNLNLKIRVEGAEAFLELARLFGLVTVRTS